MKTLSETINEELSPIEINESLADVVSNLSHQQLEAIVTVLGTAGLFAGAAVTNKIVDKLRHTKGIGKQLIDTLEMASRHAGSAIRNEAKE